MDSNYQYAGLVNVDDDGFASDIIRMAAAMAASARLARSVRVRTTQPSRRPHLVANLARNRAIECIALQPATDR